MLPAERPAAEPGPLGSVQDRLISHRLVDISNLDDVVTGLDEIFASFSQRPVASASLAQVHEARLHDGERVAVKVQYPEIAGRVRGDLANLRALFRAVGFLERDFDLMPLVDELGTYVPRELNFVNEAHNLESIGRFFKDRDDIAVPRVHWELTTRRVLVMDYVEGMKVTDRAALKKAGIDPEAVARLLVEAYCEQVFVHGFFGDGLVP